MCIDVLLTSDLQFIATAALNNLLTPYHDLQGRAVPDAAQARQYLRDAVIGEHGDLVDVVELPVAVAVEAGPQVRHENLRPFEEANGLAPPCKRELVPEAGEVAREQVHQPRCGPVGRLYAVREAALVLLQDAGFAWLAICSQEVSHTHTHTLSLSLSLSFSFCFSFSFSRPKPNRLRNVPGDGWVNLLRIGPFPLLSSRIGALLGAEFPRLCRI